MTSATSVSKNVYIAKLDDIFNKYRKDKKRPREKKKKRQIKQFIGEKKKKK